MEAIRRHAPWLAVGVLGAFALALVSIERGENVNALWIVIAAVSTYLIAYRYYSLFIANRVMRLDPARPTPAERYNDGLDYVPTDRYVLFGHHFAAIAGAGPLVGPVLAAQMGYLPGTLWILAGVVLGVWMIIDRSGLSAISSDLINLFGAEVRTVARQMAPSLSLYAGAAALIATALAIWWWAERDVTL